MNPALPSHDASTSRQDVAAERDGSMARSNAALDARVGYAGTGALAGVAGLEGAGKGVLSNAIAGLLPVHQSGSDP